jgi:hypothetical protein
LVVEVINPDPARLRVLVWVAVAGNGPKQHHQLGDHLGVLDVRR